MSKLFSKPERNINKMLKNKLREILVSLNFNNLKQLGRIRIELDQCKFQLTTIQRDLLYYKILYYFQTNPIEKFEHEVSYLQEVGHFTVFPYKQKKNVHYVSSSFDIKKKMPYVIHSNNNKLYFPRTWSTEKSRMKYIYFIERESILGGDYMEKTPHQYQDEEFRIEKDDVLVDIGSAEGLFSLESINLVKKAILIESDKKWIAPLRATFEPYLDKVVIINELASDVDSDISIRLETILNDHINDSIFLKIDIEGNELSFLKAHKEYLTRTKRLKIACCSYHRNHDAEKLKEYFNDLGYKTNFLSEGYMIYPDDENIQPPYFRKGIIRCQVVPN